MEDEKIIELLHDRNELGLTYTAEKYYPLYRSVLHRVLTDRQDVDECANDVLLSVWNTVPPNWPVHFPAYICRIAHRIGINRFKFNTRQKRNSDCTVLLSELEGCIPSNTTVERELERKELTALLDRFLALQDRKTRIMFLRRYWFGDSVAVIAAHFSMRPNAVSVHLLRTRAKLRAFLLKEGYSL